MGRRRQRDQELHARFLPARTRPVHRTYDAQAGARDKEEPQGEAAARALPGREYQSALRRRLSQAGGEIRGLRHVARRADLNRAQKILRVKIAIPSDYSVRLQALNENVRNPCGFQSAEAPKGLGV